MALGRQPTTAPLTIGPFLNNGGTQAYTVDAGSNRVLMVRAGGEGSGTVTGTSWRLRAPTYNGVALTRLGGTANTWGWVDWWYLINPPTGSNTFAWGIDNNGTQSSDSYAIRIEVWQDADQTTPFRAIQTATGSAANTSTLTVPSVASTDQVMDIADRDGGGVAMTPGADQVEDFQVNPIGTDTAGSTQPGTAGGAMNYTFTANPWAYAASAIIQVSGGAVNVNAQMTTSAQASSTASHQKGVSRASAQQASSSTPMAHSKGVSRAVSSTGQATTSVSHTKGVQRSTAQSAQGVMTSSYSKGALRGSTCSATATSSFEHSKGVLRSLASSGQGTVVYTIAGIVHNVNASLTTLAQGVTAYLRSVGVLRALSVSAPATSSTVRVKGVLRSAVHTGQATTVFARIKGSASSMVVVGLGQPIFSRRVGMTRTLMVTGRGETVFTIPPVVVIVYSERDGYGHPARGTSGAAARGLAGAAARGHSGKHEYIGERT